jgi:hypothetical protein
MRKLVLLAALALVGCGGPPRNAWYNSSHPSPDKQIAPDGAATRCSALQADKISDVSILEIAEILHGGNFKKREFETTSDYEKRISIKLDKAKSLIRKRAGDDGLIFFIQIPPEKIQYNADTGIMTIGREYSGLLNTSYSLEGDFITVKSSERPVGTYVGENSFGVKRRIVRMQGYQIGISAPKGSILSGWPSGFGRDAFKPISVRVDKDRAKKTKDEMAVVFSGRLRAPYLVTTSFRSTPKIDAPFDRTIAQQIVQVDIDCAAIFDRVDKKVAGWIVR